VVATGTVATMEIDGAPRQVAVSLAERAGEVDVVPDSDLWRRRLNTLTKGRLWRTRRWRPPPETDAPWQDSASWERDGWRDRVALWHGEHVFAVVYRVCRRCCRAWVEYPYTDPRFRRAGLASAGLAALRVEHPGVSWHTLGGHINDSSPFWNLVGAEVPGGYRQRERCAHVPSA
jgi:hypothetical protein